MENSNHITLDICASHVFPPVFLKANMIGDFSYFLLIYAILELWDYLDLTLLLYIFLLFEFKLTICSVGRVGPCDVRTIWL